MQLRRQRKPWSLPAILASFSIVLLLLAARRVRNSAEGNAQPRKIPDPLGHWLPPGDPERAGLLVVGCHLRRSAWLARLARMGSLPVHVLYEASDPGCPEDVSFPPGVTAHRFNASLLASRYPFALDTSSPGSIMYNHADWASCLGKGGQKMWTPAPKEAPGSAPSLPLQAVLDYVQKARLLESWDFVWVLGEREETGASSPSRLQQCPPFFSFPQVCQSRT